MLLLPSGISVVPKVEAVVVVDGIPSPKGGSRSSSSDPGTLVDNLDLLRGVDVLGGKAKFDCFAVCRSSLLLSVVSVRL